MSHNSDLMAKYVLYKTSKLSPDPYLTYFGSMGSTRTSSQANLAGIDCFTITSISPMKSYVMENLSKTRQAQNFRISNLKQTPNTSNSQKDEKNKRTLFTRGALSGTPSDKIIDNKPNKNADRATALPLRERLEKKGIDEGFEKDETLGINKREQSQKENKMEVLRKSSTVELPKYTKIQSLKEYVSESEKLKIQRYFRYRLSLLTKIIEDKTKNNHKNEASMLEEIWKSLKSSASTKRKYKFRDIVGFNQKLRETMRSHFPLNGKSPNKLNSVNLEDETSTKLTSKKSKSPERNKAGALGDFIIRKKEVPGAKVFIIIGGYPDLKRSLEERGWIENPDSSSKNFNLKWSSKLEMRYDSLKPHQYVNHFENNTVLTTKVGLTRTIRNLIWYENEDIDKFFPRCYDLNEAADFDDFLQDFKFEQTIATLRLAKNRAEAISTSIYQLFKLKLCISLSVCERRLKTFDSILQDTIKNETSSVTQEEWELMSLENLESILLEDQKYTKLVNQLKRRYGVDFKQKDIVESDTSLFIQAEATLARLERIFPQITLDQGKNVWIVKPGGLSRGRGICCHNSLNNILDHISIKESDWVIQKYIENPLIIKKRKFDIRQWVLVTDWNPLTIWFYEECYIRFSAHDFNPEDLDNKFAHLTNNAIGKNASNFETSEIEGNMWDCFQFKDYLQKLSKKDIFEDTIKPQMKHIVLQTLLCGQHDMADSRKNSFELYGYDFMIDEDYKTWVLEINSSPSMDYSTSITERLVKGVLGDCVKVIVDYGMAKGEKRKYVNTGNFQCIFSGKKI